MIGWKQNASRAGLGRSFAMPALAAALLVATAGLACLAEKQFALRRDRAHDGVELALFPSGRLLPQLSLGRRHFVADLAWLAAIQYYGRHRLSDRRYPLADHLFRVITECDPAFENAYLFGALILAEAGENDAAVALLERGVKANPGSWLLCFELGFLHFAYTKDWDRALPPLRRAAAMPGAPEYVARFAAAAGERAGRPEIAAQLWAAVARESANEEVRRIARERLAALGYRLPD
ncbi:MAG: hypothetical protein KA123_02315 [Candidatus Eisenbacteria bacterium]|nr:hypothetical protein [Candidatus Eisenbacteria bacterium]